MGGTESVVVIAAGEAPATLPAIPHDAVVIAADGGLDWSRTLGLRPEIVVGDLDSVSPQALAAAEHDGVRVVRHPVAKDATDLELALDEALALNPHRILVVASAGGRLDHLAAALLMLGSEKLAGVEVDAVVGDALVHVVRGERVLHGRPGETVTLLALHGPAEGVATDGLTYPLREETLAPGSSRGVSNVFAGEEARITIERGVLLVIRPRVE